MKIQIILGIFFIFNKHCWAAFKTCEEVPFCANLRHKAPESIYSVDSQTVSVNYEEATVTLDIISSDGSANLTAKIYSLENDTVRLKITEKESNRYELVDVLDGEQTIKPFDAVVGGPESASIIINHARTVIGVTFSPFSLRFFEDDVLEMVFDSNNLHFDNSAFAFGITFPGAVQLCGLAEHAERITLQNTLNIDPYRLRNLDVFGYALYETSSLYGSIPVLYGHGPEISAGIFFHNAAEQWYEISSNNTEMETYIMAESGTLDLFMLLGPRPRDLVRQYTVLTGKAHLPQLWTLGYHQSRYSYMTQEEVMDVMTSFDNANFPLDSIWLDIDYTDGMKYFTWNPENFSNPLDMQQFIASANRKIVTIIDPHIKVELGYNVYDGALAQDFFVHNSNGSVFEGQCWPGLSSYIDFLNPEARNYFSAFYHYENFPGSTTTLAGIWNDMNEPSVFDGDESTLPGNSLHFNETLHRDIHNLYGFLNTMATHQGLMERDNGEKRPFILSRSHFAGSQRYTAIWTGDNQADWQYLYITLPQCLNSNMLGLVFCGADIGGFSGNPSEELLQRWYQVATWLPFFRAHSAKETIRREPYLFSPEVQGILRNTIQLRYKHLPVWYTLFFEHTRFGDPLIRPLFYQYPSNAELFEIDNQLLLGTDIMIRAITEPGMASASVYFPGGSQEYWLSENDNTVYRGEGYGEVLVNLEHIPVFYRRGSVIVRKDTPRSNTEEMLNDGYTLYVSLGEDNKAHGRVYLDDYVSFKYKDNIEYNYLNIDFIGNEMILSKIDENSNSDKFEFIVDQIIFKNVTEMFNDDKIGCYNTLIVNRDQNGNLLTDIRFDLTKKTVVKL